MQKSELKNRVADIRAYLESVGTPISSNSAHEIVARALGLKNKHVLKASLDSGEKKDKASVKFPDFIEIDGKSIPVRAADSAPYSADELRASNWHVSAVISVPLDKISEAIDSLNEFVSKALVGHEDALCDIGYKHLPQQLYSGGNVAMHVTGYIEDPEFFFAEESESDKEFYESLKEFYALLEGNAALDATYSVVVHVREAEVKGPFFNIRQMDAAQLSVLQEYARSHGANNDEVNNLEGTTLLELETAPGQSRMFLQFSADDLKYASKMNDNDWFAGGFVFSKCAKT